MENITIPKGDTGYNLAFTIKDADGDAYVLTDYTVTLKVWVPGAPDTLILADGTCVIDDENAGTCHYALKSGDFDTVARYTAELELTQSGIIESTESFRITVVESG